MKIIQDDMHFVQKTWGWERWIVNNNLYCGKILCIGKDNFCSYHYHKVKDEVLYIQSGAIGMCYDTGSGKLLDILYPARLSMSRPALYTRCMLSKQLTFTSSVHITKTQTVTELPEIHK